MSFYDEVVASLSEWQAYDGLLHLDGVFDDHVVLVTPEDMTYVARAEITRRVAQLLTERGWHCTRSRTRVTVYRRAPERRAPDIVCRRKP